MSPLLNNTCSNKNPTRISYANRLKRKDVKKNRRKKEFAWKKKERRSALLMKEPKFSKNMKRSRIRNCLKRRSNGRKMKSWFVWQVKDAKKLKERKKKKRHNRRRS
ncbi:unnamed protein product [Staurois parvus]|uniref:Uncharacterized protein n=1 Tax=Staurois parvus TaxID=386267 RepID=A0ABN9ATW2_9NEOB|nr:unnamed protein product [Staurois parvus]